MWRILRRKRRKRFGKTKRIADLEKKEIVEK